MNNKIIIINGPNINLLGEREQSQYGSTSFEQLKENCLKKGQEIGLDIEFSQSNIEGELVNIIQDARKRFDGMVINAAAFLDSKLREMKKSSNLEENKITILTALRITDEYLKSKASKDASEEAMNLSKNLTTAVDKLAKKVKTQKEMLSKI